MIKRTSEEKKALDEKIGAYKVLGYTRDEISKLIGVSKCYLAENFGVPRLATDNTKEAEVRRAWVRAKEDWDKLKGKKKITIKGVLYDVIQVTENFLTVCRGGQRHTVETITKIEFYMTKLIKEAAE